MSQRPDAKEVAGLIARLAVGGIFIYSGAVKALAPAEEFAYAIESYKVLNSQLSLLVAYVFPWVELYAGLLLAAGAYTRFFSLFCGLMLCGFEALLAQAWLRKLPITSCGCFGSSASNSIAHEFVQNLGLLCLAAVAFRYAGLLTADRAVERSLERTDA